jgi:hypothetical protein
VPHRSRERLAAGSYPMEPRRMYNPDHPAEKYYWLIR